MTSFLNVVLVITFYQTGPDGLFYFSKVFNLILQSAFKLIALTAPVFIKEFAKELVCFLLFNSINWAFEFTFSQIAIIN